jgi:hypothetical protein
LLPFPWQLQERDHSFAVAKYGIGQKIKKVDSIKLQALNFVNKQQFKHVNQILCRVKKSAVRIKINFLSLRLAFRQGLDSLEVACFICLEDNLLDTRGVTEKYGQILGTSSTYQCKKQCPYQYNVRKHLRVTCFIADFPAQGKFVGVVFREMLRIFFVSSVLFTDKARLGRDGIINIHNQHQWSEENSNLDTSSSLASMCGAGIVGHCLVEPQVLPQTLTANHYRYFLLHDLPKLL